MDGLILPVRPVWRQRSASTAILQRDWPSFYQACRSTYFPGPAFFQPGSVCRSPAGYMLCAVLRMEAAVEERHSHRCVSRLQVDQAAAHEVQYHWVRGRKFERPEASLYVCLQRLVVERPERIFGC